MRALLTLAVVVAVALPLAACGRKGRPVPPEDAVYPRMYPHIELPDQKGPTPEPERTMEVE